MAPQKPHLVCFPLPAQGHINAMFKLVKLLHSRGFYITLVLTEFDFARLANSSSEHSLALQGYHDFCIETIPDGFAKDRKRRVPDLDELFQIFHVVPKEAFKGLLTRLLASSDRPPISSIISDWFNGFPHEIGKELGIPVSLFVTTAACGLLGFMQYDELVKRGYFPLQDESCLTSGYLNKHVDWVPEFIKGVTLRHLPTFCRSTNPNDTLFNHSAKAARTCSVAESIICNTFDDLEGPVLEAIKTNVPNVFTIGPLSLLSQQIDEDKLLPLKSNLWKEDTSCFRWLDKMSPRSVVYVNYGSLVILTPDQLQEFAWGLANSNHRFLWIIRSDLVEGGSNIITDEYLEKIEGRGMISGWCPQEEVLKHPSIAVFLTHSGWNSTLECITSGVPMICWPFFAEQQINSLYVCQQWRIGIEMEEGNVKRDIVKQLVTEIMENEKGKELKKNVLEWKKKAEKATSYGGSSHNDYEKLVEYLKCSKISTSNGLSSYKETSSI